MQTLLSMLAKMGISPPVQMHNDTETSVQLQERLVCITQKHLVAQQRRQVICTQGIFFTEKSVSFPLPKCPCNTNHLHRICYRGSWFQSLQPIACRHHYSGICEKVKHDGRDDMAEQNCSSHSCQESKKERGSRVPKSPLRGTPTATYFLVEQLTSSRSHHLLWQHLGTELSTHDFWGMFRFLVIAGGDTKIIRKFFGEKISILQIEIISQSRLLRKIMLSTFSY